MLHQLCDLLAGGVERLGRGDQAALVKLLSEYMRLKTGSDLVYVQSDRNDQELARKGFLRGISINR
jgi:hypothetical protein